ncbi:serine/threonine-protein kinase pdik1l-B-like [Branchiostoma floridae]|uniref:Serine/threonine-protein kinase pdik1l-B-like n=1 Tax=Branchiostoma floridae TaxID=7739 RepID=A0A9J7L9E8_BRAFL|nr:serine/threonine-protein kinase pdik1l-B-like [Branchiostoma floridae]
MAEGVAYLHGRNIVHRDLKPENLLVENSGPRPVVKIADFGLARVCGQTGAGGFNINQYYMDTIAGTRYYWPPEMLRHMLAQQADQVTYTAKTDIWAMGIIIAAILDRMIDPLRPGKLQPVIPVDEQAMPVAEAILRYPGFPLADMLMKSEPPGSRVKDLALSMLAVNPHQRPTSDQVLRSLRHITNPSNRANVPGPPAMPPPVPHIPSMPAPPPYTSSLPPSYSSAMRSPCPLARPPSPMHTVVEIPVESSERDSENQTSWMACCCAACWKWDSDKKFYSLAGKGLGWVIVLLIMWVIAIAVVFYLFPIFFCYYLYCHKHCCDDS